MTDPSSPPPGKRRQTTSPFRPEWTTIIKHSPTKPPPTWAELPSLLGVDSANWSAGSADIQIAPIAPGIARVTDKNWVERRRSRSGSTSPTKRRRLNLPPLSLSQAQQSDVSAPPTCTPAVPSPAALDGRYRAPSSLPPEQSGNTDSWLKRLEAVEQAAAAANQKNEELQQRVNESDQKNEEMQKQLDGLEDRIFVLENGNAWHALKRVCQASFATKSTNYITTCLDHLKATGAFTVNPNTLSEIARRAVTKFSTSVAQLEEKERRGVQLREVEKGSIQFWRIIEPSVVAQDERRVLINMATIIEHAERQWDEAAHTKTTRKFFDKHLRPAIIQSGVLDNNGIEDLWIQLTTVKLPVVGRAEPETAFE